MFASEQDYTQLSLIGHEQNIFLFVHIIFKFIFSHGKSREKNIIMMHHDDFFKYYHEYQGASHAFLHLDGLPNIQEYLIRYNQTYILKNM